MRSRRPLRVLTWHVHGNYLWYLSQVPHELWLPVKPGRPHPYGGRAGTFPWPDNVREIPADEVPRAEFDVVLYQTQALWLEDRHVLLSEAQRRLPSVVIEHDPPLEHPFAQRHPVDDEDVLVVHVTEWNRLMWDGGRSPTRVIEHGVVVPEDVQATYELPRGIVAINHLRTRSRRMGADLFLSARERLPLDLVGMDAESLGGLGEVDPPALAAFQARYRFAFSPIRQTSLGLALLEAMAVGLPIVGLATGELARVIGNGESGWLSTSLDEAVEAGRRLVDDPGLAARWGEEARRIARGRFGIRRFADDWDRLLTEVAGTGRMSGSMARTVAA